MQKSCLGSDMFFELKKSLHNHENISPKKIWPKWTIYLNNCVIIAEKHIHMSVADAKDFGFRNNQMVNLKTPWKDWKFIEKVRIRTNDKFEFDLHLNEDEWKKYWLETNERAEILQ